MDLTQRLNIVKTLKTLSWVSSQTVPCGWEEQQTTNQPPFILLTSLVGKVQDWHMRNQCFDELPPIPFVLLSDHICSLGPPVPVPSPDKIQGCGRKNLCQTACGGST